LNSAKFNSSNKSPTISYAFPLLLRDTDIFMRGIVAKVGPSFDAKTTLPPILRCGSIPRQCIYLNARQEEIVDECGKGG
jgi:hypothetical protein